MKGAGAQVPSNNPVFAHKNGAQGQSMTGPGAVVGLAPGLSSLGRPYRVLSKRIEATLPGGRRRQGTPLALARVQVRGDKPALCSRSPLRRGQRADAAESFLVETARRGRLS